MKLTAGAPLPVLLDALSRAGWADLDTGAAQGVRSTLNALRVLLPHKSATGTVTTNQVADAAGLSSRWTARCLHVLEAAGLIVWTRGQLIAGTPMPGVIRVVKVAIVDLIRRARNSHDDRTRARAAETSARIRATLRNYTQHNRPSKSEPAQQSTLSVRVELRSTLPPQGEETRASVPVVQPPIGSRRAALREAMRRRQQENAK